MGKLLVLHGPNLNLLGSREPEIYGSQTLDDINAMLAEKLASAGHQFAAVQSNAEHELVDQVQLAANEVDFIIINPGAFTHTSIALRDALLGVGIPFIEVHLSNVFGREDFRRHSYLSDVAVGCICGLGASGYSYAADYAVAEMDSGA